MRGQILLVEHLATIPTLAFAVFFIFSGADASAAFYVLQMLVQPLSRHLFATKQTFPPRLERRLWGALATETARARRRAAGHLFSARKHTKG